MGDRARLKTSRYGAVHDGKVCARLSRGGHQGTIAIRGSKDGRMNRFMAKRRLAMGDRMMATRTICKLPHSLDRLLVYAVGVSMAFVLPGATYGNEIESKWTEVDSIKVHYLESGPPTGLPVLLLHGGRYQAETWRETGTLKALSAEGYHVLAVDLPGFGKTPKTQTKPDTWLGKLIDALHLDRPVVVSPSMSGRFAMPYVVAHSDRLRGFVAVAPVGIKQHENALARISVPLLAIWGENDKTIPLSHADLLRKYVAQSRKVVVPKAGHALYMDDAATFHRELILFLKQLEKP